MRGSDKELRLCAPIAQLVEQMTLNHWVLGSSPRGRTIFFCLYNISKLNELQLVLFFLPIKTAAENNAV